MLNRDQVMTEEHKLFVSMFEEVMSSLANSLKSAGVKGVTQQSIGKCLHFSQGKTAPTLYAKVGCSHENKKFLTCFRESAKGPIEDPLLFENDRCMVTAIVCIDSVYVGGGHLSVQVRVSEASLNFGAVSEETLLPESDGKDEW